MLFVDTSVWFAVTFSGDRNHERAKRLLEAGDRLAATDHVLVET